MKYVAALLLTLTPHVLASEPGQPLDCTDWVSALPGFTCSEYERPLNDSGDVRYQGPGLGDVVVSVDGDLLWADTYGVDCAGCQPGLCSSSIRVWRGLGGSETVVGSIQARCQPGPTGQPRVDQIRPLEEVYNRVDNPMGRRMRLLFDPVRGRLFIPVNSTCSYDASGNPVPDCQAYAPTYWYMAISGFTNLLEVFQSYAPSMSNLGFRVPYMPEGMNGVDYFDTYWGDLATVGNWSAVQGLACDYPAAPPSVGDYLEVADTLPAPGPGQGYYYVTAAHFTGETRYGRRTTNGRLTGRDPAALPACMTAEVGR